MTIPSATSNAGTGGASGPSALPPVAIASVSGEHETSAVALSEPRTVSGAVNESRRAGSPRSGRGGGRAVNERAYEQGDGDLTRCQTTAIARGDTKAFSVFYEERFEQLYRLARRLSGRDEAFCLDVVQDAMIRIMKSMRPIDTAVQLDRWLRAVVLSVIRDRLRRETRMQRRERRWAEAAERTSFEVAHAVDPATAAPRDDQVHSPMSSRSSTSEHLMRPSPNPAVQLSHGEQLRWIEDQLRELDEETRHLMHLRFRVGWTLQRIGDRVGLTPSAVDGRIGRTMRRLQAEAQAAESEKPPSRTRAWLAGPSVTTSLAGKRVIGEPRNEVTRTPAGPESASGRKERGE